MTEPHRVVVARLSADIAAVSQQLARTAADLAILDRLLAEQPVPPAHAYWPQYTPPPPPPPPPAAAVPRQPRDTGWIGKMLAVAGVVVTLVGVVLLLVLAAQAGLLRPGFRVAAGGVLAVALVAAARWLNARPGGRVGAVALAATGVAAAYLDVVAVTTVYEWVSAPLGLILAAAIGGAGLTLARRWDAEHLALLVLVPLIGLAPVLTDGDTLLLVGFMVALSAAALPVQIGKDWRWMFAARTAACTVPLVLALLGAAIGGHDDLLLAGACVAAAALAIVGALILLPRTGNRAGLALLAAVGMLPVLGVSLAVDRVPAALLIAALAAVLVAIVLMGDRLPGVPGVVRQIWSVLAAAAAVIAVTVAFRGEVAAPVLLAMATVVAVAGRRDDVARWVALAVAGVGGGLYLCYAPPSSLSRAVAVSLPDAVAILVSSLLAIGCAVAIAWSWAGQRELAAHVARLQWAVAAVAIGYAVTAGAVTAGVLISGTGRGFVIGHMTATISWIVAAAGLLGYAARRPKTQRSLPIGSGLAVVGAAMAKLFLFDLGALDGIFRVLVFIVTGLVLLGMGTAYARMLAQQDQSDVSHRPDRTASAR